VVVREFFVELRVGLRHGPEELIGLIDDLNPKHPERAKENDGKANQDNRHTPIDGKPGVFAQPRARAPKQYGEKYSSKDKQQDLDGICHRGN